MRVYVNGGSVHLVGSPTGPGLFQQQINISGSETMFWRGSVYIMPGDPPPPSSGLFLYFSPVVSWFKWQLDQTGPFLFTDARLIGTINGSTFMNVVADSDLINNGGQVFNPWNEVGFSFAPFSVPIHWNVSSDGLQWNGSLSGTVDFDVCFTIMGHVQAVPLPPTVLLLGSGLLGLAGWRRFRKI
jgi:hypothetical protein